MSSSSNHPSTVDDDGEPMSSTESQAAGPLGSPTESAGTITASTAVEELRRQVARRDRRNGRIAVWSAFGGVAIIALGLVGFGYWTTHNKPSYVVPKHATVKTDGLVAGGTGPVKVDMYVDYECAACKTFETSAAPLLTNAVAANKITLIYHPLTLNGAAAASQYSTRAAASAACASDLGAFMAYSNLLFASEPVPAASTAAPAAANPKPATKPTTKPTTKATHKSTSRSTHKATPKATPKAAAPVKPKPAASPTGLSDDQLVQVGGAAGIINPDFAECLRAGKYDKWVANENKIAAQAHITTAPTVLVNGVPIAPRGTVPTLAELTAAIG